MTKSGLSRAMGKPKGWDFCGLLINQVAKNRKSHFKETDIVLYKGSVAAQCILFVQGIKTLFVCVA